MSTLAMALALETRDVCANGEERGLSVSVVEPDEGFRVDSGEDRQ